MKRPDPAVAFRGTPPASTLPGWYPELLASVTEHVSLGHRRAVAAANTELLAAYGAIDRAILERQHEEGYGTKVIDRLSADLRERLPDARGYSPRNLKCMRAFAAGDRDHHRPARRARVEPAQHRRHRSRTRPARRHRVVLTGLLIAHQLHRQLLVSPTLTGPPVQTAPPRA